MARDICQKTMTLPDPSGVLRALAGIRVSVYRRGTTNLATIYQRSTGAAEGPAPEVGAASGTNPFVTGSSGGIEFWLDQGQYDIELIDTQLPARISSRSGSSVLGFEAMPAAAGGLPSSILALDAGIRLGHLGADVVRQDVPIGGVVEWWRPASTVPVPTGYEICDARTVASHDFGTAGSVALPDLRNKFILGADSARTDGTGAGGGDAVTDAPGIRGSGGSNRHTLASTEMPVHSHTTSASSSTGAAGTHSHGGATAAASIAHSHTSTDGARFLTDHAGGGGVYDLSGGSQMGNPSQFTSVSDPVHAHGINPDGNHTHTVSTSVTVNNSGSGVAHNNMPIWVGLLRIMKVKRS